MCTVTVPLHKGESFLNLRTSRQDLFCDFKSLNQYNPYDRDWRSGTLNLQSFKLKTIATQKNVFAL